MITGFDVSIFLGILLAMLFSKWPKQFAIAVCALASLAMIGANYLLEGVSWYYFALMVEASALVGLMLFSHKLKEWNDRHFFRVMSFMFLLSIVVTWMYTFDWVTSHALYVQMSHAVALIHVFAMLSYADGIRDFVQYIGRRFYRLRYILDL